MKPLAKLLAGTLIAIAATISQAAEPPFKFGVGLFQPDKDRNDFTPARAKGRIS